MKVDKKHIEAIKEEKLSKLRNNVIINKNDEKAVQNAKGSFQASR